MGRIIELDIKSDKVTIHFDKSCNIELLETIFNQYKIDNQYDVLHEVENKIVEIVEIEKPMVSEDDVVKALNTHYASNTTNLKQVRFFNNLCQQYNFDNDNICKCLCENFESIIKDICENEKIQYGTKNVYFTWLKKILCIVGLDNKVEQVEQSMHDIRVKMKSEQLKKKSCKFKDYEEAKQLFAELDVKLEQSKQNLTEDVFDKTRCNHALGLLVRECGVLRGAEVNKLIIVDKHCENVENYIDVKNKKMVIRNHKMQKKWEELGIIREFDISDELADTLQCAVGHRLLHPYQEQEYKCCQKINNGIYKKSCGSTMKEMRQAKCSLVLMDKNVTDEKIKTLEMVQGHSLKTMLDEYALYVKT